MHPFTPERSTGTRPAAWRWLLVAVALVATLVPHSAEAQVLYGTLTGNVTDPSGASAAGATVTVTNVGTGVVKTATTDDRGAFNLSDLLPGTYDVVVEAASFQPFTQRGIVLTSNTVRRVDVALSVSGVSETLEVTATTPLLQADRADLHFVQTARQVNDLPLAGSAGRNYQSLMQVVPGAVLQGEQNSAAGSPQRSISFNVNGVSRLQNNTKLDGASIQYPWLPTNTAYVPSSEAIQEVSIVTN
ncbi:MAG: carboxypeptidase-like regulatory domain-containing protein, partial [Vicinamibacteria bacterium]